MDFLGTTFVKFRCQRGVVPMKIVTLTLACSIAYGQTAITALTSFWEMNVTDADRIAWDSKGAAHGTYFGTAFNSTTNIFGTGWYRGAGTQLPFNSGGLSVPGGLVDTGSNSFAYCTWIRPSTDAGDVYLSRWSTVTSTRSWLLSFNALPGKPNLTYQMTDGSTGSLLAASPDSNAGQLTMVCFHYNSSTGQLGISGNGQAWDLVTPVAPFQVVPPGDVCSLPIGLYDPFYPCTLDFSHIHDQFFPAGEPIIGRTMFWNGYVPTNAELTAIYNNGLGRAASYYGLSFTPPARPLTVTLADATFASDANLPGQEGLYWLQPFPLYNWNPPLAGMLGNYVWTRSTDHAVGSANEKLWIGFSSGPVVLPVSWTQLNPPRDVMLYPGLETPMLVWNPDTNLFHLYARALLAGSSNPYVQQTLVWTSPDLSTWTFQAVALPANISACPSSPCYNHTGYAYVIRNGPGNWTAQSLLDSGETGTDQFILLGIWTSADGITWTLVRQTQTMVPKMPYRNQQNQRIGVHVSLADSLVYSENYYGTPYTQMEFNNPPWPLFFHSGTAGGDFLQGVRTYVEGSNVYLYAKWSFQQTSTVRLFTGVLNSPSTLILKGDVSVAGSISVQ